MRPMVLARSSSSGTCSTACVLAICTAEILGLAGYSIVPAVLPQLMGAWSLNGMQSGWLAGVISGGYMLGVIPMVAATDRISARAVYLGSAALSVISSFGLALSDALGPALVFRALSGLGLAGMYMPGLAQSPTVSRGIGVRASRPFTPARLRSAPLFPFCSAAPASSGVGAQRFWLLRSPGFLALRSPG